MPKLKHINPDAVSKSHRLNDAVVNGINDGNDGAPERDIAVDMVRRSIVFAVPLALVGALGYGWSGFASVALAMALVLVNFMLGAAVITWGARLGNSALMGTVLGGYLVRLGIVTAVVFPIRHSAWFEVLPFAVTLLVSHLGLLIWETRYVSASLAFPSLKPPITSAVPPSVPSSEYLESQA